MVLALKTEICVNHRLEFNQLVFRNKKVKLEKEQKEGHSRLNMLQIAHIRTEKHMQKTCATIATTKMADQILQQCANTQTEKAIADKDA